MISTRGENGKLIKQIPLQYLEDKYWLLLDDIKHRLHNGDEIIIPKGMKTDLSSTPKFLWGLMPPYGNFLLGAIVHDWLYISDYQRYKIGVKRAREFADREMLIISNELNNNKVDNWLRWVGARLFGGAIYKKTNYHYTGANEKNT